MQMQSLAGEKKGVVWSQPSTLADWMSQSKFPKWWNGSKTVATISDKTVETVTQIHLHFDEPLLTPPLPLSLSQCPEYCHMFYSIFSTKIRQH